MHIPDGLMDPAVFLAGWAVAVVVLAVAMAKVGRTIDQKAVPLMALLAAGIFMAQMLNFPVGFGTTGHLIGAALAVYMLGPLAAMVVMTAILLIQGLMFGDGGITALGLNILNMAIIAPLTAWGIFALAGRSTWSVPVAAWASVMAGAAACAFELSASYTLSGGAYGITGSLAIPAMLGYHALIGIGEGLITGGIVAYLTKVAPEMVRGDPPAVPVPRKRYTNAALGITVLFGIGLVLFFMFSAGMGDGLESVMEAAGVEEVTPLFGGLMGYGEDYLSALVAGIIGFAAVFAVIYLAFRRRKAAEETETQ